MDVDWRRAAAYVVCRDDERRLLLTRFALPGNPDSGSWTMPGGGMEWGESPADTAHRELEEETGLRATLGPVIGVFSRWYPDHEAVSGRPGHALGIVYEATELRGELRTTFEAGTTDGARWFHLGELPGVARVELVDFVLPLIA